jgi:ankyrin repeat protein
MFFAAYYGDLKTIKIMLNKGVSSLTRDFEKRTALLVATSEGYLDIVEYLV